MLKPLVYKRQGVAPGYGEIGLRPKLCRTWPNLSFTQHFIIYRWKVTLSIYLLVIHNIHPRIVNGHQKLPGNRNERRDELSRPTSGSFEDCVSVVDGETDLG